VVAALERAIRAQEDVARRLAQQLAERQVTVRQFDAGMREVVKNTQLFSAAAARGGWAQMDARTYGMVGQQVREQYGFLNQFRDELRAGLGREGIAHRAASYADAGRRTHHLVERETQGGVGKREERNVLNVAEHCGECVMQAQLGWVAIGTLVPVGQRECKNGCKCEVAYR
jgi:hypothetical protein